MVVKERRGACSSRASALEAWLIVEAQGVGQRRWTAFGRDQKRLMVQGEAVAGPTRVESHFRNTFLEKFGVLVN